MVRFPNCKINLGLHVVGKREDGYHDIETCFYPLPWNDILEIIPSKTISFTNTGINVPGPYDDNVCLKAYYLLQDEFDLPPVDIHLHKIVPMGAGLGGGSSDGANTLIILNELFAINLSEQQLEERASELGSDCAFFIHDGPMMGMGRGEILRPIDLSLHGKFMVVVKPDIHVSTKEAYNNIVAKDAYPSIRPILEKESILNWKNMLKNDFEDSVFSQFPVIEKIKNDFYNQGSIYASMSGSGSSVFGIFDSAVDLKKYFDGMAYWSGSL